MTITLSIKSKLDNYGVNLPTDGRTRAYANRRLPGMSLHDLPSRIPPRPPHLYPSRPTSSPPSLLPPSLSFSHATPPPASHPHPPPRLPSSLLLSSPSHLLVSPARPAPLTHIVLPSSPPTLLLPIFPLPPIALPPFLLSLIVSTPSFSAYVLLSRVRSSSTWAFNVCLCVCSCCLFLDPETRSARYRHAWSNFV